MPIWIARKFQTWKRSHFNQPLHSLYTIYSNLILFVHHILITDDKTGMKNTNKREKPLQKQNSYTPINSSKIAFSIVYWSPKMSMHFIGDPCSNIIFHLLNEFIFILFTPFKYPFIRISSDDSQFRTLVLALCCCRRSPHRLYYYNSPLYYWSSLQQRSILFSAQFSSLCTHNL